VDTAVLIPVKRFQNAKARLSPLLSVDERVRLARWLATRVVDAARPLPVFIACDDDEVAAWAESVAADVLWSPGMGLNGAVDAGRATVGGKGFEQLIVAHSDLPLARDLASVTSPGTITIVPDRRLDGTNVLASPVRAAIKASYGSASYRAHLTMAMRQGHEIEVRHDPRLALDVDNPQDLAHPALRKELPRWLQTILASRL
jgi:2-phospho-L-lactate/phosphoenolpyruvate guanylyltransferase